MLGIFDPDHILRAPNVLNSLSMAANLFTGPGDGIIVQPPVFFDFADIIAENGRRMVENPLVLVVLAAMRWTLTDWKPAPLIRAPRCCSCAIRIIPVGRVWTKAELARLGAICRSTALSSCRTKSTGTSPFRVTPTHRSPVSRRPMRKTASPACPPPKASTSRRVAVPLRSFPMTTRRDAFKAENSRLTVNKNNAFASVAMEAAYKDGGPWLDAAIAYIEGNLSLVRARLCRDARGLFDRTGRHVLAVVGLSRTWACRQTS